jgi:hypothetical protein
MPFVMYIKGGHIMKKIFTIILIATICFAGGYLLGQHNTIINASLHNITEDGYQLNFNGQIHNYN